MKLNKLAEMIIKDGKLSSSEVIEKLSSAIERNDDDIYLDLYECAYGKTLTKSLAEEKVRCMEVTDGTDRQDGQKWTFEQCVEVGNKLNIDWQEVSKAEWYFVMNMMYSDYYCTAKYCEKQNDTMFFAHLSKDWVYDQDVPETKTYDYIFKIMN